NLPDRLHGARPCGGRYGRYLHGHAVTHRSCQRTTAGRSRSGPFAFCAPRRYHESQLPMDMVRLPAALYERMLAHLYSLYPEEACGLIGGRDGLAERLYHVENILHRPVAYEMEPLQQIRAIL